MRMLALLGAFVLVLTGCDIVDVEGLNELDDYASMIAGQGVITSVVCPDTISIGQSVECAAYNFRGTRVTAEGQNVAIWESYEPSIAEVDLLGVVTGVAEGTTWIFALGTRDSYASDSVVVIP